MRLIDADALMDVMYHEAFETDSDRQKWDSGCWIRYKMFEEHINKAPTVDAILKQPHGLYECFHCGAYAVAWGNDFTPEDVGYEGDGVVHQCSCGNCGAMIEYVVLEEEREDERPNR